MVDEIVRKQCDTLLQLQSDLADNLIKKGVEASTNEKFNTLVPKVLDIPSGIGGEDLLENLTLNEITNYSNDTLTYVKSYLFYNCTNLKSVSYPNATELGGYCFAGCTSLKNINLPKVKTIGGASFRGAGNLGKAIFQNATTLSNDAFSGAGLTVADFGSIHVVSSTSLNYNPSFKILIIRNSTMASLANVNAFLNTPFRNGQGGIAYVPQALIEDYKIATNWSSLESITFLPLEGSPYENPNWYESEVDE